VDAESERVTEDEDGTAHEPESESAALDELLTAGLTAPTDDGDADYKYFTPADPTEASEEARVEVEELTPSAPLLIAGLEVEDAPVLPPAEEDETTEAPPVTDVESPAPIQVEPLPETPRRQPVEATPIESTGELEPSLVELEPLIEPEDALLELIEADSIDRMPILEEEPAEDEPES
jgi:hypothetical protein